MTTVTEAVAYATSKLRDRSAAEDVVQDCYCRLLAKAEVYDLPRDGRKLLFEAVTNACINRVTRARPTMSLDHDGDGRLHESVADPSATPAESVAMGRELEAAIGSALLQLPAAQRKALELKSQGHSLQEIARALRVTANNAGVLVHRARQAMARHLAPHLEADQAMAV